MHSQPTKQNLRKLVQRNNRRAFNLKGSRPCHRVPPSQPPSASNYKAEVIGRRTRDRGRQAEASRQLGHVKHRVENNFLSKLMILIKSTLMQPLETL